MTISQTRNRRRKASWRLRWIFNLAMTLAMTAASPGLSDPYRAAAIPAAQISANRSVTVGLNKSAFIDLPEDVADVVISNPAVVDAVVRTARRVHLLGQQIGQASATFISREGKPMLTLDVAVERDLSQIDNLIRRLIPDARVQLEMVNDNVVLSGTVTTPMDATHVSDIAARFVAKHEQVLNLLTVEAKEQVVLRVTVAEMNRTALRRLGVDLQETFAAGSLTAMKVLETAFPVTSNVAAGALYDSASGVLQAPASSAALVGGFNIGKTRVDALVQALEREGLARTLAEPTLTSVSGETANFLAGGEYPIPVGSNNNGTTITFKPFGVTLNFTPVVLSAGRISLKIATEVSELTTDGAVTVNSISIPALKVRRASSTLELPSGGSLVMAGLLSRQTRRSAEGMPGLKELPVLGSLFRSDDFIRSETELVVLVTPYLVASAPRDALQTPGAETAQPDSEQSTARLAAGGFGYIVE